IVSYTTVDGTATAGSDYNAISGTLTFAPGVTTKTVSVAVKADNIFESDENFFVNLSSATNAVIIDEQSIGTILNDDPLPALAISNILIKEGNFGPTAAAFHVTLTNPSYQLITVNYATADNTAVSTSDY